MSSSVPIIQHSADPDVEMASDSEPNPQSVTNRLTALSLNNHTLSSGSSFSTQEEIEFDARTETDSIIEVNPALVSSDSLNLIVEKNLLKVLDENNSQASGEDSDYFTGGASGTTSLFSNAYNYEFENGRRYHSFRSGKYLLPNDDIEQDRLDLYHYLMLRMLNGELHIAPVQNRFNMKVLDVGTGTGVWAIDFADMHPDAEVIGVDLSPIQPASIPNNLRFEIDDVESEWTYPENEFDFIHIRSLAPSIKDWPALIRQAYRCLKPNGWLELCEAPCDFYSDDGSLAPDSPVHIFAQTFNRFTDQMGLIYTRIPQLKGMMAEAGFVDIKQINKKMPMGAWPADKNLRELGKLSNLQRRKMGGLEAHCLALFTRVGGMSIEEATQLIEDTKRHFDSKSLHCYTLQHWFAGRKPRRRKSQMDLVQE